MRIFKPDSSFISFITRIFSLKEKAGLPSSLILFLFANLLVIFALYQTRPVYLIDVGTPADAVYLDNFNAPETNGLGTYRWTGDESEVILPPVGSPFTIEVQATVSRPVPVPVHFSLTWDNPTYTRNFDIPADEVARSELKGYALEVNNRPPLNFDTRRLIIQSDSFKPGQGDARTLGILVHQVSVQARSNSLGFVTPPLLTWLLLSLALLSFQSCLGVLFIRQNLLAKKWQGIFYTGALLMPLALAVLFFAATPFFLVNSLALSPYLLLSGVVILVTLLTGLPVFRWLALGLLGLTLANLYGFFDVSFLLVFGLTLFGLCFLYNPRLQSTGLNLLIIATLGVLASWGILQKINFRTADAERHHFMWLNQLDILLRQGEFYPRWATDFAFGHGSTVFNFYAPVSRYLGEIFVLAGLPAGTAYRGLLTVLGILGGIGLYFAARQFLGKPSSVIVAAAYLFNPYRLANIYQRGSIAEAVAFSFLPFLLLAFSLLLNLDFSRRKAVLLGAITYALVVCSHQLTGFFTIIFFAGPYILLNLAWLAWQEKQEGWPLAFRNLGRRAFWVGFTLTLGLGLSAFYVLPAFAESGSVWLGNYVRYKPEASLIDLTNYARLGDWVAHIEKLKTPTAYLENLSWIGISHLLLAGLGLVVSFIPVARKHSSQWLPGIAGLMLILLLGMQLNFTALFWQQVPFMRYIEFPWRLMIFVGLFAPLLIGFLFERTVQFASHLLRVHTARPRPALAVASVALSLIGLVAWTGEGNVVLHFTDPTLTGRYTQQDVYTQVGDYYYLPMTVAKNQEATLEATLKDSDKPYIERDNRQDADPITMQRLSPTRFQVTATLSRPGKVVLPVFYFAGWKLTSNGQTLPIGSSQPLGLITAQLPPGAQVLELKFEDTPIRSASVLLTVICGLVVLVMVVTGWKKRLVTKNRADSTPLVEKDLPDPQILSS
ncbi:MAG: hypothetical protein JWP00_139 [Chloroflexi bacterium]|nr:hypothetical protein [Chloroflexota bacterium]